MLKKIRELSGFAIHATDGDIGTVDDFLFEDDSWKIRYVVVDTGRWLPGRRVLLSPLALGQPDWDHQKLPVALTRQKVKDSPDIDTQRPVSRRQEEDLHNHYLWPPYWIPDLGALPGNFPVPIDLTPICGESAETSPQSQIEAEPRRSSYNPHLRSVSEVLDYDVEATDGAIGQLEDLLFDEIEWSIQWLVVDTGIWIPGVRVLISPRWVSGIVWPEEIIQVALTRERIQASPAYDPDVPFSPQLEEQLYTHYRNAA